ncbi:4-(cytidine 5'-diphospho)-2-C-methyl-D-erythritol kinase [candidate division KSB1 bacterium]
MTLKAPAKINFGLWIGSKRGDGYHPVSTIFLPVALYDTVTTKINDSGLIQLQCDTDTVPSGEDNLCWKAADLFRQETNSDIGISIKLTKNIPVGAGLGGGSSDAAAVLMALNRQLYGVLSDERLFSIAAGLGADIPFFLYRQACAARGIGEQLSPIVFPWEVTAVIAFPGFEICTADAYAAFDMTRSVPEPATDFNNLIMSLSSLIEARETVVNAFEPVVFPHYPVLAEIKEQLYKEGAEYASLSGSGSAIYGLFRGEEKVRYVMKSLGQRCRVYSAEVLRGSTGNRFFESRLQENTE